jgi:hypothetical protein
VKREGSVGGVSSCVLTALGGHVTTAGRRCVCDVRSDPNSSESVVT